MSENTTDRDPGTVIDELRMQAPGNCMMCGNGKTIPGKVVCRQCYEDVPAPHEPAQPCAYCGKLTMGRYEEHPCCVACYVDGEPLAL